MTATIPARSRFLPPHNHRNRPPDSAPTTLRRHNPPPPTPSLGHLRFPALSDIPQPKQRKLIPRTSRLPLPRHRPDQPPQRIRERRRRGRSPTPRPDRQLKHRQPIDPHIKPLTGERMPNPRHDLRTDNRDPHPPAGLPAHLTSPHRRNTHATQPAPTPSTHPPDNLQAGRGRPSGDRAPTVAMKRVATAPERRAIGGCCSGRQSATAFSPAARPTAANAARTKPSASSGTAKATPAPATSRSSWR